MSRLRGKLPYSNTVQITAAIALAKIGLKESVIIAILMFI